MKKLYLGIEYNHTIGGTKKGFYNVVLAVKALRDKVNELVDENNCLRTEVERLSSEHNAPARTSLNDLDHEIRKGA